MKNIKMDSNFHVISSARERIYKNNSESALLLLHGFTGSPNDMDYLAKEITNQTEFSVYIPRLPGHGTNKMDFRQCRALDWLRKAYDSYLNLKEKYRTVHIAGLSMGGLISILMASDFNIEKLILIAPALYSHHKLISLSYLLKYILPVIKNDSVLPEKFDNKDHLHLYQNYWKEHYTTQVAELHKLMRLARKKLPSITAKTLILASKTDEQVPIKAISLIENKLTTEYKKIVIFEESPHVINNGSEKVACANHITQFLLE